MFLTIPAAIGLAMLRFPAVVVLFQRGKFTDADAVMTASALGFYCLGIVPQAGIEIHSRGFYALGDTRTPVVLAVLAVFTNLVLSALLWKNFEHEGLAFSVSASSWLEWTLLYVFYLRRTGSKAAEDLNVIAVFTFCGAAMAFFLAIAFLPMEHHGRQSEAVIAIAGTIAGVAVYAGVAHALGVEELREAVNRLRSGIRRGAARS
jgi:putative peptidoglycan lipid II flippase